MTGRTAYLYEDEAGNYDFTLCGSKYFIMTCVVMYRPFEHLGELLDLKYDCIEDRYNHHTSESDINLQIADYICWALQRKWERGDLRSYELIGGAIVLEKRIG